MYEAEFLTTAVFNNQTIEKCNAAHVADSENVNPEAVGALQRPSSPHW
jgi:hypothetical protein